MIRRIILSALLLSCHSPATADETLAPRLSDLEAILSAGSQDVPAALFAMRGASVDSLCELLKSKAPYRGSPGYLRNVSTYYVDISEEELNRIDDPDLRADLEAQSNPDPETSIRRRLIVGEVAAYLLAAIFRDDYDHSLTAELVGLEGQQLQAEEVHRRLKQVHGKVCKVEAVSETALDQALLASGLSFDPR